MKLRQPRNPSSYVRRKFYEAKEQSPRTAAWLLRQIQHLYRVEAELRESRRGGAGPQLRLAVRTWQSRPIVTRLKGALIQIKTSGRHLPQSLLGSAIDYTVIESCRRRKLNPYAYLKDVLSRLPRMTNKQIPEVTRKRGVPSVSVREAKNARRAALGRVWGD